MKKIILVSLFIAGLSFASVAQSDNQKSSDPAKVEVSSDTQAQPVTSGGQEVKKSCSPGTAKACCSKKGKDTASAKACCADGKHDAATCTDKKADGSVRSKDSEIAPNNN